jgi:multidrug efflux pump
MISHFFIDRPIFATVLSIVITLAGGLAVRTLPIAQYPPISPPMIQVAINYPGASSLVVADTVAAPIEQQVNGVPGMLYMSSISANNGSYTLQVTFQVGTDLNTALVMVQNRVQLALPLLPTSVQNQGITIRKKTPDVLLVISFFSKDGRYDGLYLSNFATINVWDPLLRVDGVSDVLILGMPQYSMRAWLDPQKLASRNMNAGDVALAVAQQNTEIAAGRIGQTPADQRQQFDLPIDALGRLTYPEQFADIIVKAQNPTPTMRSAAKPPSFTPTSPGSKAPGSSISNPLSPGTGVGTTAIGIPGLGVSTASMTGATGTTSTTSSTGTTTSSGTTPGSLLGAGALAGGASTGGGASASGGGTTSGGGLTGGGATTGGAAGGSVATPGPDASSQTSPLGLPGISINTSPDDLVNSGGTVTSGVQSTATAIVKLRDVGRVELGALNYNASCLIDGKPSGGIAVFALPGTNALDVADRVKAKLLDLKKRFPSDIDYLVAYDTTPFIRESVNDVERTLFIAVVLVGIVVLVFLQNWRAVLIPMLAVPVAIVGTFAVMALVGFSLNNISLFGLVLAIGIVVDDAIVVVENVERWLNQGHPPREAARKAMDEVSGPVIAVALVLCAVFVPCAFISGITGRFFRQFAVTIAASTVFSALNSLTLSPALAALLLHPNPNSHEPGHDNKDGAHAPAAAAAPTWRDPLAYLLNLSLGWFFVLFNRAFAAATAGYGWIVGKSLRFSAFVLVGYGGLLVLTYVLFARAPTGFVPNQDQGRVLASVNLPDSASLARTERTLALVESTARKVHGVSHTLTISGTSFVQQAAGSNLGSLFIVLAPFEERTTPDKSADGIMTKLREKWAEVIDDGVVQVFPAPPIPGVSVAGGFKMIVEDRGGLGVENLQEQTDKVIEQLRKVPGVGSPSTLFRANTPMLFLDFDRKKVASLGVSFDDLNATLGIYLGSLYVNSYDQYGRYWQVTLQADEDFRSRIPDLSLISVRSKQGQMVPLSTLVDIKAIGGPLFVQRYNLYTAAPITGNIAPGFSSGPVISAMEVVANETLPRSMGMEWTELVYLQILEGNTTALVFSLAVLAVFLTLAAQYESWALPLAVILVVPTCLLCSVIGVTIANLPVDVFVQIGLVVLVGLACKNSILIVEFARQLHIVEGKPRAEATIEASRMRLRPILMTSFAFILGVFPLVIATGAGAEMRHSLGTAVFAGMFGVTLFGVFLTPVFFYVILGFSESSFFSTPRMKNLGWAAAVLLNILLLGLPWMLGKLGRGEKKD